MSLFEVTEFDRQIYERELKDFLPAHMIDIHTHIWLERLRWQMPSASETVRRTVTWPLLVARENSIADLQETYRLMFPEKRVTPLTFSLCEDKRNLPVCNDYVQKCAKETGYPALYFSKPEESAEQIERAIRGGGYLGLKSYLDLSPEYIPEPEIRIYDFFPPCQLKKIDELGLIVMLHIPRNGRLKDPVNIAQILEIKQRFPRIKLILAHIGRAYCECDVGDAFERLAALGDLLFDFSANTSEHAMFHLLNAVGPKRVLFGSDLPIVRMRMRRIEENGTYINLIPPGLYGDPRQDPHLREVSEKEGGRLTLFMYEEILAFKRAAGKAGLGKPDIEDVFFENARKLLAACGYDMEQNGLGQ